MTQVSKEEKNLEGGIGDITGIPIFEDKFIRHGTYICLDKNGLPISQKDLNKTPIAKIIVHDIETFKIAIKNNNLKEN